MNGETGAELLAADTAETLKSCPTCHNAGTVIAWSPDVVKLCPTCGGASNPALMAQHAARMAAQAQLESAAARQHGREAIDRRAARKRQRQARKKGRR